HIEKERRIKSLQQRASALAAGMLVWRHTAGKCPPSLSLAAAPGFAKPTVRRWTPVDWRGGGGPGLGKAICTALPACAWPVADWSLETGVDVTDRVQVIEAAGNLLAVDI